MPQNLLKSFSGPNAQGVQENVEPILVKSFVELNCDCLSLRSFVADKKSSTAPDQVQSFQQNTCDTFQVRVVFSKIHSVNSTKLIKYKVIKVGEIVDNGYDH